MPGCSLGCPPMWRGRPQRCPWEQGGSSGVPECKGRARANGHPELEGRTSGLSGLGWQEARRPLWDAPPGGHRGGSAGEDTPCWTRTPRELWGCRADCGRGFRPGPRRIPPPKKILNSYKWRFLFAFLVHSISHYLPACGEGRGTSGPASPLQTRAGIVGMRRKVGVLEGNGVPLPGPHCCPGPKETEATARMQAGTGRQDG